MHKVRMEFTATPGFKEAFESFATKNNVSPATLLRSLAIAGYARYCNSSTEIINGIIGRAEALENIENQRATMRKYPEFAEKLTGVEKAFEYDATILEPDYLKKLIEDNK